jgi:hypothetical protein
MRQHTVHDQTGSTPRQSRRGGTGRTPAQITGPAAERARTVLATASSAGVTPAGQDEPTVSVWLTEHDGRLMVQATGERCSAALQEATRSPHPCDLEVADVAPLPLRSRIRARMRLQGSLLAAEPHMGLLWHFLPDQAWLDLDEKTCRVGLTALGEARPDPFARFEPGLLAHLESAHADVLAELVRRADPRVAEGVARVRPLMLNRYGLALRIEYARDHRDIHVPFPDPVDTGQGLTYAMRALVANVTRGSRGRDRSAQGRGR